MRIGMVLVFCRESVKAPVGDKGAIGGGFRIIGILGFQSRALVDGAGAVGIFYTPNYPEI